MSSSSPKRKSTSNKNKLKDGIAVGHNASRYMNPIIKTPITNGE